MKKAKKEAAKAEEEATASVDAAPASESAEPVAGSGDTAFSVAEDGGIIAGSHEIDGVIQADIAPMPEISVQTESRAHAAPFADRYRSKKTFGALEINIAPYHIAAIEKGEGASIEGFAIESSKDEGGNVSYFLSDRGHPFKSGDFLVEVDGVVWGMSAVEFFKEFERA